MSFTVGVFGIAGVGKTQFLDRLEGKKLNIYRSTLDTDIREIQYGNKIIEFRDFVGLEYYDTDNEYFVGLDLLLLMVDNRYISYKNGKTIASDILVKYSPSRVMVVQNKIDIIQNDKLLSRAHKISVKTGDGIEELMEEIIGNLD